MFYSGGAQGREEQQAKLQRLREEIGRVIEREYAVVGKYHELAASFETLMPDPKLRHDAVLQALSTTMKLDRAEIAEALGRQQEELRLLETAVGELFADLRTRNEQMLRVGQGAAGPAGPTPGNQHCPKCGEKLGFDRYENRWKCYACSHQVATGSGSVREPEPAATPAATTAAVPEGVLRQPCTMCGGEMHYHAHDERWLCYTCAHEEAAPGGNEAQGGEPKTQGSSAPSFVEPLADMVAKQARKPAAGASFAERRLTGKKKTCPVCQKKMDWHEHEKMWRCFFCNHKSRY